MKFYITSELALLIKTLRTQNKIPSKELADRIGKSNSYISKLESGDVKNIREEDLTRILTIITGGGDFYEKVLPDAVKCLNGFLEPDYIFDQLWLIQYDVIERPVRLTEQNTGQIRRLMEQNHIAIPQLIQLMNSNIDSEMDDSFPPNEYVAMEHNGSTRLLVRVSADPQAVRDIIEGNSLQTTYYMIQVIVFNLFRLALFPEIQGKMPSETAAQVLRASAGFMDELGITSLTGFVHLLSSDYYIHANTSPSNVLSSLNSTVEDPLLDPVNELFREFARRNPTRTAQVIDKFNKNLNWDPGFMLKLMEAPFYQLGSLSYTCKKQLIEEILATLTRYDDMTDFEKKFETY